MNYNYFNNININEENYLLREEIIKLKKQIKLLENDNNLIHNKYIKTEYEKIKLIEKMELKEKPKNCKYNNKCFNKSCTLTHVIKPDIKKNYKEYIFLEKEKNPFFKSESCKNDDCKYHIVNKCKYKHIDDPNVYF